MESPMRAVEWRAQMREKPVLRHEADGLILVQLGEHSVLFPSEADARFFFEAYTDVPNLASEGAYLRTQIDEKALANALAREKVLEVEVEQLKIERAALQEQAARMAEKAAAAVGRARILAVALKRAVNP